LLFDPGVKTSRRDLFDRERELEEIFDAVRNREKLIVVYGVRRVGKSSLVNVALREIGEPFAIIDVRALYFESGFRGVSESVIVETLLGKLRGSGVLYEKFRDILSELISRIESISMGFIELRVGRRRGYLRLIDVLGLIDDWCRRNGRIFIIALDEAQYLRFSNKRYDLLLAWSIDNLSNILYVLTGSEVGLLHDFLRLDSTDSPLRGRVRREVYVEKFSVEQSVEFLRRGFEERGVEARASEIEEVVKQLNGVPGWLTLYGYYRVVRGMNSVDALNKVLEEGTAIVTSELDKVIERSRGRYTAILKAIAMGFKRWKDIKAFVEARTGPIPPNKFSELLERLVKYGYVKKINGEYAIDDPIVKHAVLTDLLPTLKGGGSR